MRLLVVCLACLGAVACDEPGPKVMPTCQDYAALLVRVENPDKATYTPWYLCFDTQYSIMRSSLDPEALPR